MLVLPGHRFLYSALIFASAGAVTACKSRLETTAAGVLLASCDGTNDVTAAERQAARAVTLDHPLSALVTSTARAAAPRLALAVARDVPWPQVQAALTAVQRAGQTPLLLCADYDQPRRLVLDDTLVGKPINLVVEPKGKFCVQTPELAQAFCVQGALGHIPVADVRMTVRDTVKAWSRTDVQVAIAPQTEWADVVRAIDGARTCCGKTAVRVALHPGGAPIGDAPPDFAAEANATNPTPPGGQALGAAEAPVPPTPTPVPAAPTPAPPEAQAGHRNTP